MSAPRNENPGYAWVYVVA